MEKERLDTREDYVGIYGCSSQLLTEHDNAAVEGHIFGLHLQPQLILLPRHGTRSGSGSGLLSNILFPHTRTCICLATLAPVLPLTDPLLMISD
jgi:hypothetical protein